MKLKKYFRALPVGGYVKNKLLAGLVGSNLTAEVCPPTRGDKAPTGQATSFQLGHLGNICEICMR